MSSGKYHTLGPYVPPSYRSAYLFHSLQDPDDGHISALYFNDLGVASSVRDLVVAVECPMAPRRRTCPDPPWPSDLNGPGGAPGYEWYYSEAELVGACSLRTCTDNSHPECPVIGVLVLYQDGTTKVLGQWRVDKASNSPRYAVSENEHLHWTMASDNALSHVKELFICDNNCPDDASSVCITMSGRLFWWFSSSASVLHHEVF